MDKLPDESRQVSIRAGVLHEALEYTLKDRNTAYGDPEDNFANIADLWIAYLRGKEIENLNGADVAAMMILMKIARLKHNQGHRDSWVDVAGYGACGAQSAGAGVLPKPSAMSDLLKAGLRQAKASGETVSLNVSNPDRTQLERDIETVKNVAEKVDRRRDPNAC
jgi:hypothetical protein